MSFTHSLVLYILKYFVLFCFALCRLFNFFLGLSHQKFLDKSCQTRFLSTPNKINIIKLATCFIAIHNNPSYIFKKSCRSVFYHPPGTELCKVGCACVCVCLSDIKATAHLLCKYTCEVC